MVREDKAVFLDHRFLCLFRGVWSAFEDLWEGVAVVLHRPDLHLPGRFDMKQAKSGRRTFRCLECNTAHIKNYWTLSNKIILPRSQSSLSSLGHRHHWNRPNFDVQYSVQVSVLSIEEEDWLSL